MTRILGLNAWHADSAACLLRDGRLVAAAEEEPPPRREEAAGPAREGRRGSRPPAGRR